MAKATELMGAGRLQADVFAEIPLADAKEAHRIIENREQTGKVLLVP
jgi:NADPH:quinone reductase-like Zn-dependent oxidoreductase